MLMRVTHIIETLCPGLTVVEYIDFDRVDPNRQTPNSADHLSGGGRADNTSLSTDDYTGVRC